MVRSKNYIDDNDKPEKNSNSLPRKVPCPRCGVWTPVTEIDDHAPCNGKMIDPRSIRR